ncbi:ATP-binding cassette domain-containing protein [Rhodovulum sulfidophilum]|uniref:peptidase domain-containing ABC transporter n=1 Tax=Rhodovulum sulfidophilum TaxID=35806 RepID=UPI0019209F0C|nr:ATP-binding cassette domain-containing protein [Rhodovulum sulfidophilum]MBL3596078.1 ATP-binding cassette domain-containing protein [Rhodovulum sulfidophilum]
MAGTGTENRSGGANGRLARLEAEPAVHGQGQVWDAVDETLAVCLYDALRDLGWQGELRDLRLSFALDLSGDRVLDTLNAAARLGFAGHVRRGRAFSDKDLARTALGPGGTTQGLLFLPLLGEPRFLRMRAADARPSVRLGAGSLIRFERVETPASEIGKSWLGQRLRAQLPLVLRALLLTFFANLAAVANPLFVMAVYDKVVVSESTALLAYLAAGVVAAAWMEMLMRRLRGRIMNRASLRLGYIVGNAVFGRILTLPSRTTERAGLSSQIARVRDVDRIRDLLRGPLEQALLDTPFTLLFVAAVAIVGGWLALIPLCFMILFAAMAAIGERHMRGRGAEVAKASAQRQLVTLEMMHRMRAIRAAGGETVWLERYRDSAAKAARASERNTTSAQILAAIGQSLGTGAALATLFAGIFLVLADAMTTGGLIASMMLVWRLIAPIQNAFLAATRIGQLVASARQIDRLMETEAEIAPGEGDGERPPIQGEIAFNRVTFRYGRETEPILGGVSFTAQPGEIVAIVGRNGSGKSTLLKLVAGLYEAQAGNIRLDGRDLRQFDPTHLRRAISYVPQLPSFHYGTLRDNLLMAEPEAEEQDIAEALQLADAATAIAALPEGLDTFYDAQLVTLPVGLLSRLSLARMYLRKAPVVLLDEPATGIDFMGEFAFIGGLELLRARGATVLIVTHNRQHLGVVDKILMLEEGTVRFFGSAEKVRDRIPKGLI